MAACSPAGTCTPMRSRISGAPITMVPASGRVTPLHLRDDANGTSTEGTAGWAGMAVRMASAVELRAAALAASRPAARRTWASSCPGAATTPPTSRRFSVSVPVLSTHTVSTLARLSMAFSCWASVPMRARRTAATANVRLASSTRPSGTRGTSAATTRCTDATVPPKSSHTVEAIIRMASGTITAMITRRMRLMSSCSGDSVARVPLASAARRSANESAPTAVTR